MNIYNGALWNSEAVSLKLEDFFNGFDNMMKIRYSAWFSNKHRNLYDIGG